jgi:hypothetical protein
MAHLDVTQCPDDGGKIVVREQKSAIGSRIE